MGKTAKTVKKSIRLINNKTVRTTKKIKGKTKIHFRKKDNKAGKRFFHSNKRHKDLKSKKISMGRLLVIDVCVILLLFAMFAFIKLRRDDNGFATHKHMNIAGTWYKVDLDIISRVSFSEDGIFSETDMSGKKISSGKYRVSDEKLTLNKESFDMNFIDEKEEYKEVIDKDDISQYELRKYFYTGEKEDAVYYFFKEDDALDKVEDNLLTNKYYEKSGIFDKDGFAIDENGILLAYKGNKTEITIPSNVRCIAENAMSADYDRGVDTKKVIIPDNVKKIAGGAFSFSTVEVIVIEAGVEEIENWAFGDSKIKKIYFPDNIKTIHEGIFDTEEGLEGLEIHCSKGSQVERYFETNPPVGNYKIIN